MFRTLLSADGSTVDAELTACLLANMTICPQSNEEKFIAIIYNPLSRSVSHYVKLPVNSTTFQILGPDGIAVFSFLAMKFLQSLTDKEVDYQVTVAPRDFGYTGENISLFDLVFHVEDLPPLGYKVYSIKNLDPSGENATIKPVEDDSKYTIGYDVTQNYSLINLILKLAISLR